MKRCCISVEKWTRKQCSTAGLMVLLLLLVCTTAGLANPLTLDECVEMAFTHLQYEQQTRAYEESAELAVKNAGKSWLPQVTLDGSSTYQNENVSIPVALPIPGLQVPEVPLAFHRLLLDFTQTIYDGSMAANKKHLERSRYTILQNQVEIEKIQTKSKVISLYISTQLADERLSILRNRSQVITERKEALVKAADFGGATIANVKTLEAELLLVDQNLIEAQYSRSILLASLGETMGQVLPESQELLRPDPVVVLNDDVDVDLRPEMQLLDSKIQNLSFQQSMLRASRRPQLTAFATVGAGSPGYDIFKDEIATMAMIGARLHWQVFDWNLSKNERQILSASQDIARSERLQARVLLRTELKKHEREIEMMNSMLAKDDKIVKLRSEISAIRVAEVENGTITSTDYISELNLEEEARLNQKVHELRLVLAKLNYLTLQGNN